jgi:branched-chain amino acid transport system ATP-binding protein
VSLLAVEGLVVRYGQITAVKGISLHVEEGEVVALVGGNGAGKTTTLLALSGVLTPHSGTIRLRGEMIHGLASHVIARRGIAQVVEGRGTLATLTVAENLMVGGYIRRDRRAVIADMEQMYTRFPRLGERRHLAAGTLSGGEQQMLAIARALMSRPAILLLDEPSMGLAPLLVEEIFRLISAISQAGTTILLVEQNAMRALSVSHRAYILASGAMVTQGPSRQLLQDSQLRQAYLGLPAI